MSTLTSDASTTAKTPAVKPPPGVSPNFDNPESLAKWSNVTVAVCIPVVTIFFVLRAYVRAWIRREWIFEDWLALMGWAGTVAFCAVTSATMEHHGGQHVWDLTVEDVRTVQWWFNTGSIVYGAAICIVKLAVLWLYRRVFSPRKRSPFDITIQVLIVVLLIFYIVTTTIKIFECSPRQKIFNRPLPGHCVDIPALLNASGLFNTLTDFIILLIPVKAVWNLQVTPQKKIVVVIVFTFGLCAPIFSLVGFIVRIQISANPDTTWNQPEILLWGAAELCTGNLCVCFPVLGGLLKPRAPSGPSLSIVQGLSRSKDRKRRLSRPAGESCHNLAGDKSQHVDLELNRMYSVDIGPVMPEVGPPEEGKVHVRSDVSVS